MATPADDIPANPVLKQRHAAIQETPAKAQNPIASLVPVVGCVSSVVVFVVVSLCGLAMGELLVNVPDKRAPH